MTRVFRFSLLVVGVALSILAYQAKGQYFFHYNWIRFRLYNLIVYASRHLYRFIQFDGGLTWLLHKYQGFLL